MSMEIMLVAVLTGLSTSLLGVFLVLRRLSMLSDAISHTVLLGIVLAFMVVNTLQSPLLMVGATLMGVITVYLIEILIKSRRVKEDAAIGIVFTLLFAVAVILINTTLRNVHLDIDMVLLGNLEFVTFDRLSLFGVALPTSAWVMGGVFAVNVALIAIFYKELKLVSFDYALATALGFSPLVIHYVMMLMVSLTAVAAFNAVGAILVIALFVGPPITALQFTKTLFPTIVLTQMIAIMNSVIGYGVSFLADVTIAGTIASMTLLSFLLAFLFAPKKGLIGRLYVRNKQKRFVALITLVLHVMSHEDDEAADVENGVDTLHTHLGWSSVRTKRYISTAKKRNYVFEHNKQLMVTRKGQRVFQSIDYKKV